MNIKNKIKTLLLTLMVFTCGCTQYLELDPLGQANGEQVWGSANGCRQLLSGTYSLLRRTMLTERPFYLYGDLPSQTVLKHNHWIPNSATNGDYVGAYLLDWWVSWEPWYRVIGSSNTLLKHINDVPDEEFNKDAAKGRVEKKQIEAEANFLYAYTYFWLVRIYGDVPLSKEAFESVDQALQGGSTVGRLQAPEKEILEYLIKRLDAAIVNLDYDTPDSETWSIRADKAAALTLKAHICTWLANRNLGTAREKELLEMADACLSTVIAQSGRSLVDYDDDKEVAKMFEGQSSESIYELNLSVDQNEAIYVGTTSNWSIHSRSYWRESMKETMGNPQNDLMVADMAWSTTLYPVRDIRREIFFENFGNSNGDKQLPPVMKKYAGNLQEDPNYPGRYFSNSNVVLLRLTDVYLLRAEVLYKLGRTGNARNILDQIRNRSHIGNFIGGDSDLAKGIFEERARELVGEGQVAFDRIRNNNWTGLSYMSPEREQKKGYYWPMHIGNLQSSNRELEQVPWWAGKL